jgi:thiamine biosynthesis lipoprotein
MKATVRSGRAMASPLRVTLPGARDADADAAFAIVATVFESTEADLSRFCPDSSLSRLNLAAGTPVTVPRRLAVALHAAWRAFRTTGGRFDPRIIGALELAGEHAGIPLPPSPARLRPGEHWLRIDRRSGTACVDAPVDLGGIGKGLALRWAATALRRAGHADFLVHAGGDVVARGRGPAGRPWVIGIEDPAADGGRPRTLVTVHDGALATSSVTVRRWIGEDGEARHHLIDPTTLEPAATHLLAVTVAHADPTWAEVLSKVGILAGARVAHSLASHRAWWFTSGGRLHASARKPAVTPILRAD